MAINYNNQSVKRINYDGQPVYKVVKDGTVVWCKPYTVLELPSTATVSRYTNPYVPATDQKIKLSSISGIDLTQPVVGRFAFIRTLDTDELGNIQFSYHPIGEVSNYSAISWVREEGNSQSLMYGGERIFTIPAHITAGPLKVEKVNKIVYTYVILTTGNSTIKMVFGYEENVIVANQSALKAHFDGIYYMASGSNPHSGYSWATNGVAAGNVFAWQTNSMSGSYQGIFRDMYAYSLGNLVYNEVACEEPGPDPQSEWRYVGIGDTVYYGDLLMDYDTSASITVEGFSSDSFQWRAGTKDFPNPSVTTSTSGITITDSTSSPAYLDAKVTFYKYSGKNVQTTSVTTNQGFSTWSPAYGSWGRAFVSIRKMAGAYCEITSNWYNAPNWIYTNKPTMAYTLNTSKFTVTVNLGSGELNWENYIEYSYTLYYAGGGTTTGSGTKTLTPGQSWVNILDTSGSGSYAGGNFTATVYCCSTSKTLTLTVGSEVTPEETTT